MKLFVSMGCPNCTRLMTDMARIPSLREKVEVIDIDHVPPEYKAGLQYVPTLVDNSGQQYVGSKCFEWLAQFQTEVELDFAPMGGSLAFSDISGSGEMKIVDTFGEFTKPPN
jgi:hypothetical protein